MQAAKLQSLKNKMCSSFRSRLSLQSKWYRRLREYWQFLVLPALASSAASLLVEVGKCDIEFLKELNAATVQLLGFTGIILGVAFAAYYSSRADMHSISSGYLQLHQMLGANLPPNITLEEIEERSKMQVKLAQQQLDLKPKIEAMDREFRASFKAFVIAASLFAVLVIIGVLQVRICFCQLIDGLFFPGEMFLLVFGIESLLFGLYVFIRASQVAS